MAKNKNIAEIAKNNFWKRQIKSVFVTGINSKEYNVELYSFKEKYMGNKIVPHYELKQELRMLGFANK